MVSDIVLRHINPAEKHVFTRISDYFGYFLVFRQHHLAVIAIRHVVEDNNIYLRLVDKLQELALALELIHGAIQANGLLFILHSQVPLQFPLLVLVQVPIQLLVAHCSRVQVRLCEKVLLDGAVVGVDEGDGRQVV